MGRITELSRRRTVKRKQKPVVYIICEGGKSEPQYFAKFRSRNSLISIKPVISQYKDAFHLVSKAESEIKPDEFFPEYGDQIWYLLQFIEHGGHLADCDAVVRLLQPRYIQRYDKSRDYFSRLRPLLPEAIMRAHIILNRLEREGIAQLCTESNPSTSAVKLVEELMRSR